MIRHLLRTNRIRTPHNIAPARRLGAHLPRRRPIQRAHVHGRREARGGERFVEPWAREDSPRRGEVWRGKRDEGIGGCGNK